MADPAKVSSREELAEIATELSDEEVKRVGEIWGLLTQKYSTKINSVQNLEHFRDEALTRFAEANILVEVDPTPCFYTDPATGTSGAPEIIILGKVDGDLIHKYGFDHERKSWEVLRALERGEDFYGQKEATNQAVKAAKQRGSS